METISSLRSGVNEQMLAALHSVLRNAYATGRSSRGVLRQVLQLCSSSDTPVALRSLGYEILWTLTAAVDAAAYRGLVAASRTDMLAGDHPDMTLAALATLRSLPGPLCVDVMLSGEDVERNMCDAMGGDAPPHVRGMSVMTFTRIAVASWLQVSTTSSVSSSLSSGAGIAKPLESYNALLRLRANILDRSLEVLKGVVAQCEDKDPDVSASAFAALRGVLESVPYSSSGGGNTNGSSGFSSSSSSVSTRNSRIVVRGSLLDLACSGEGEGSLSSSSSSSSSASLRSAHLRLIRDMSRRCVSRIGYLMQRIHTLRHAGRAHAIRAITLLFAHAIAEASGKSGAIDVPAILRMDHAASTNELTLAAALESFVTTILLPIASTTKGLTSLGSGAASSASTDLTALTAAANNIASGAAQLEACRAFVQLCATFGALEGTLAGRGGAGDAAVQDLDAVSGLGAGHIGEASSLHTARALASGALAVDATNNYVLATLAERDDAGADYNSYCGSLWKLIGNGNATVCRASSVGAVVTGMCKRYAPQILRGITTMLRRVQSSGGASAGVIVAVSASTISSSSSLADNNNSLNNAGPMGSSSSNNNGSANSNLNYITTNDGGASLASGGGLGGGAGSSLMSDGTLCRILHVGIRLSEFLEPSLFLLVCPALLREAGRIADDVVDDPGAGVEHSGKRTRVLLRLAAMATHVALYECAPSSSLDPYSNDNGSRNKKDDRNSNNGGNPLSYNTPTYSTLLARIMYEATRPLTFASSATSTGSSSSSSGNDGNNFGGDASNYNRHHTNASLPPPSTTHGNVHAAETARVSTRFRCELAAVFLQCLVRTAPSGALLAPLAVATAHSRNDLAIMNLSRRTSRLQAAESLHTWLAFALDTSFACLWILEHRLTYAGLGTMNKDAAANALARIMGHPDALAPSPCPVAFTAPPSGSVTGMSLGYPHRNGDATVGASPDMFDPSMMSMSTAGPSGGVGSVTGWSWAREYEACAEAADAFMGLLTTAAALLLPPPVAKTYIPGAQESGSTSIPAALALDVLPPAVLTGHRAGLQRVLHLASKQDMGIYRVYELERTAHALAPRIAAAASTVTSGLSASTSRGTTYDALPSVVPLQMRLLWLVCATWDGSDGGALTAGVVAAGTSARASLPRSVAGVVMTQNGGQNAGGGGGGGLRSLILSVTQAETAAAGIGGNSGGGGNAAAAGSISQRDNELYRNTTLSIEALRQKRLSALVFLLAAEAGVALGLGNDLEAAAEYGGNPASFGGGGDDGGGGFTSSTNSDLNGNDITGKGQKLTQQLQKQKLSKMTKNTTTQNIDDGGETEGTKSSATVSIWSRGSKIGRALGFFGKKSDKAAEAAAKAAAVQAAADAKKAWTGEGTVVSHAHFWSLLDCMAALGSSQRCTAGLIKRSVECMLVQPKLSPDVEAALLSLLPRLSLWCAAYGRSQVAQELADLSASYNNVEDEYRNGVADSSSASPVKTIREAASDLRAAVDSTSIFAAVAAHASACSADPWSFTLYQPPVLAPSEEEDGYYNNNQNNHHHQYEDGTGGEKERPLPPAAVTQYPRAVGIMMHQLESFQKADDPSVPPATLELLADLYSQPALAAIAAAALPELTQNVTLGLNRSTSSGARMRTIPPISSAYRSDTTSTILAQISLHISAVGARNAALRTAGACLPITYLGCVPVETAVGGFPLMSSTNRNKRKGNGSSLLQLRNSGEEIEEDFEYTLDEYNGGKSSSSSAGSSSSSLVVVTPAHFQGVAGKRPFRNRDAILVDAILKAHSRDKSFSQAIGAPTYTSISTPLSAGLSLLHSTTDRPGASSNLFASDNSPVILTSSSDPLLITMGHTSHHPGGNRLTLHISITNTTHTRLPAGMRASLQLGAPLAFDRGSVTTAMIASFASRLGSAAAAAGDLNSSNNNNNNGEGGAMGAASAGTTLSGDFITMQRTSQHHATHTLTQPLPAGCTVTWDVVVSVAGFGSPTVRVSLSFDSVEVDSVASSSSEVGKALAKATRSIGITSNEDRADDEDDDVDWSYAGVSSTTGGITAHWAAPLLVNGASSTSNDGLIWSGEGLNMSLVAATAAAKKGYQGGSGNIRLLPAMPSANLSISRTSATRAPIVNIPKHANTTQQPSLQRGVSTLGIAFGLGGRSNTSSSNTSTTAGGIFSSPGRSSTTTRRASQQSSSQLGDGNENDASVGGGGNEDEAGSVTSGGGGNGNLDGGDGGGGNTDGAFAEDGEGGNGNHGDGSGIEGLNDEGSGSSIRPYRVRRLEIHSQAYRIPSVAFLIPAAMRFPPALSMALAIGVDLLPGSASGFGADPLCYLAAAAVEGGGLSAAIAAGGSSNNGGGGSSSGCLSTLRNGLFAGIAARAPYAHHIVAVSQPFMAIPNTSTSIVLDELERSGSSSSSSSAAAAAAMLPMSSPDWLVACAVEGTRNTWARIPLPVSPPLFSRTVKQTAADFSAALYAREEASSIYSNTGNKSTTKSNRNLNVSASLSQHPASGDDGDDTAQPLISQAAFAAKTWGGANVVLLFTGVLTPLATIPPTSTSQGGNSTATPTSSMSAIQPCMWQVSLQVRSDDARIRAALAAEITSVIHILFGGRLSVLSHGHSPSPQSILQRIEIPTVIASSRASSETIAVGGGGETIIQALAAAQDYSASLQARVSADIWAAGGPSVFNAVGNVSTSVGGAVVSGAKRNAHNKQMEADEGGVEEEEAKEGQQ